RPAAMLKTLRDKSEQKEHPIRQPKCLDTERGRRADSIAMSPLQRTTSPSSSHLRMPVLKEWNTSCPEASLTVRSTSASAAAKSLGTSQVSMRLADRLIPGGPDSSLSFTPPFIDRPTGAYRKVAPAVASAGGREAMTR